MTADLRELSLRLEAETMFDSIPTIERVYDRTDSGAYRCAYSPAMTMGQHRCEFTRRDPEAMWRHVHFGAHSLSFGKSFASVVAELSAPPPTPKEAE